MAKLGFIIPIEGLIYAGIWYFAQPALNFASIGFGAMIVLALIMVAIAAFAVADDCLSDAGMYTGYGALIGVAAIIVILLLIALFTSPLFAARQYAQIYDDDFIIEKDMSEYSATLDNIPLTDKTTANNLIIRKMGSLKGDMVSQYEAPTSYQITLNGNSVRVAPLVYAGFFQWNNNKNTGIPAYITANMETEETDIIYLEKGMKYSPSERFGRDLKRYLRSNYPSAIFDDFGFELDEEGNPYWIAPVVDYKVGLFNGKDIKAVIAVNAVTGDHEWYDTDDVPAWIDNVYPTDVLVAQYDWHGAYHDGMKNYLFDKKNAVVTTDGYNYIPSADDVYIYTGVTSLVADESNVGFVVMNKRTKEAIYYEYPGAEEYSAMSSAEGYVQQFGYTSTFPLLVNVEGVPTYYCALKDAAGLVKSYALINVKEYQNGVCGTTLAETLDKYLVMIGKKDASDTTVTPPVVEEPTDMTKEVTGVVEDIRTGDINGNTYFYIKLVDNDTYYKVSLRNSENVILLNKGDTVTLAVEDSTSSIVSAKVK